jgi:hypothetical protein
MEFKPFLFGFVLALLNVLVAWVMSGGGHGWLSPFLFALSGLIFYPLAFSRMVKFNDTRTATNLGLIILAVLLDILLVATTVQEGVKYFHLVGFNVYLWLAMWSIWQFSLVLTAYRRLRN